MNKTLQQTSKTRYRFCQILILLLWVLPYGESWAGVTQHAFDFVVGVDGDFKAAKAAAEASNNTRYYIFFPNGSYDIGSLTGDSNQMTQYSRANTSLIGQSMDSVIIYNTATTEGISVSATLYFDYNADGEYQQDLTLQNKATNLSTATANRWVVMRDQGTKNIYKQVKMLSTQDTYYSNDRTYMENCEIHGTVDFICGAGDVLFNQCLLYLEERTNNCITAPAGTGDWGYVFLNCEIDGSSTCDGNYRLGRAWQNSPRSVYLNTQMNIAPSATAWGDNMKANPTLFAEYNSFDEDGNAIDLSGRRTSYTYNGTTVTLNPVLTESEAALYTPENITKGSDNWTPYNDTKQVTPPTLQLNGSTLSWEGNSDALCYVLFKNGTYVTNLTSTSYDLPGSTTTTDYFQVRCANAMGGLGEYSNAVSMGGLTDEDTQADFYFYYTNGDVNEKETGSGYSNLWNCTQNGATDYSWAITGRNDKNILTGDVISYNNQSYTTFKSSKGAQNTIYLPDDVKVTQVSFIGYSNDTLNQSVLSEINGETPNLTLNSNSSSSPVKISYEFSEQTCNSFTFTFSTAQACFIIALYVEDCEECKNSGITTTLSEEKETEAPTYDPMGRRVTQNEPGKIYYRKGKGFIVKP